MLDLDNDWGQEVEITIGVVSIKYDTNTGVTIQLYQLLVMMWNLSNRQLIKTSPSLSLILINGMAIQ